MVKPKPKFKSKAGRIRNPKKSSRWAKGDSCLSNPETRKFREEASSLYFHQIVQNPLLTAKNLGVRNLPGNEVDEDVLSEDVRSLTVSDARTRFGSFSSYKTFASDWSKCSNGAFEKFLGRFKLDSALHKEMLSILAATTEVINTLGGTHRETEYFASFVTALDQCDPPQYEAMMALLSIVSGRVPEAVLRKTFSTIYPKLSSILGHAMEAFDNSLMRVTCVVLKKILGVQDGSIFESELPVQSLVYGILRCALHENPKVRRKARQTIGFILSRQNEKTGNDVVAKIVMGWILDQLATFPTCGTKTAGDAIGLLQFVWSNLDTISSGGAKKLYESILRVMSSGDMSLIKIGFSFFSVVFQTHLKMDTLGSSLKPEMDFMPKLVTALWEFCPDWRNNETFLLWLHSINTGLIRLSQRNTELAGPYISRLIESITPSWTSHWGIVPTKVLVDYLFHLVTTNITYEDVDACFQVLSKNLISVPPNDNCLLVLTGFMNSLKMEQFTISGREVLLQLLQMRKSAAESKINSILGQFVKSFGIDNMWISVDPDIRHAVILPLVKDNLNGSQISYWKEHISPLFKSPLYFNDVWASLVGFCRDPTDPENFPAELVGKTIVNKPKYRLIALAVLRQFCLWPQSKRTLQKYANNYLPLLFNLYVNERQVALAKKRELNEKNKAELSKGHSDAIATTIQEYLPHLEPEYTQDLIKRAINKLNEGNLEEKGPILDLLTFLSIFEMNAETSRQVYDISAPMVSDTTHMKRAYRLLQSLLKNESVSQETKTRVVELLCESKGKTKSNAEPLRLECINSLVLHNDAWLTEFLPEAILSLLSVNTRARKVSAKFVIKLCERMKEKKISLEKMETIVRLGLESENSFIISCTINFLVRIYIQVPPNYPEESLINSCINHLLEKEKWDGAVSREALSFLSLNLSLYKSKMGPHAAAIGKVLSTQGLPRKEINKMLGRMIRVFGVPGLKAVLPNSNDPKMSNRIKNLQTKLRKLKEMKMATKEKVNEDEERDLEESDDEEESMRATRAIHRPIEKLIMKEGVVDFLDPKNMTASLISKPKDNKEENFKLSSDGKLIIEDLDGKERKGKKRSFVEESGDFGNESDEDDGDDEELVVKSRKKLKSGSMASSKRSIQSGRSERTTTSSGRSMKSRKALSTKSGYPPSQTQKRPQVKAKRRKGTSTESVRSSKSTRSKSSAKSGLQKERFNYKR